MLVSGWWSELTETILITGSSGFIGASLTARLKSKGYDVIEFDRAISADMDITNAASIRTAVAAARPAVVIRLAANASPRSAAENPELDLAMNVNGTINLMRSIREESVSSYVVFLSSAYVYGGSVECPVSESSPPSPNSPYGISKFAAESYVRYFSFGGGIEFSVLRLFNIFGPRQRPGFVVPDLMTKVGALGDDETLLLKGNPEDVRDFLYIDDLLGLFEKLLRVRPNAYTFNVGSGTPVKIVDLASSICHLFGRESTRIQYQETTANASVFFSDPKRAKSILGWAPEVSLVEGLSRISQVH